MKRVLKGIAILIFFTMILSLNCDKNPVASRRCGAVCNDGTRSDATGSGACSHHGGVDHWIYCD